jgi:RNA polymerase subunit RPABC4/transcription elongation factor Spt4
MQMTLRTVLVVCKSLRFNLEWFDMVVVTVKYI